ncbi:MAG: glycosyltransferase family 4 protein [Eubacterium sp.]|nr:glycosyltransferase family 4 protein [Eubacterium sp.]
MKVLFVATVRSHIGQFHMPFIKRLKELGCTVDGAYKDNSELKQGLDLSLLDNVYEIGFSRSPYSADNINAYKQLKKVINSGNYDAIHCHTPMGAVVTRLAARDARKKGTKVIYTAHGFHFYKGASSLNWKVFYPIEKALSKYTDCLILINNEDYQLAKEKGFEAKRIIKVNGVGVNLSKFKPVSEKEKSELRKEYGFSESDFIMIYPADFCARKNQTMLFEVMRELLKVSSSFRLLLPGSLELADEFIANAKEMGVYDSISFMGYRRDIEKLVALADVSVSSTRQEGLPINIVEAMAVGNPIVATDVRGNNDLVKDGVNGYLVALNDSKAMADRLLELYNNKQLINDFGKKSIESAQLYSEEAVVPEMVKVYEELGLL